MAEPLLSSLGGECVKKQEKGRESEIECPVQRACIINEITLADGSYLGSVPQPQRFAAGSHAHILPPLLLSVPLTVDPSCFSLFSLFILSLLLFIETAGRGVRAFRPKPLLCPPPPISLPISFLCSHQGLSTPRATVFIPG